MDSDVETDSENAFSPSLLDISNTSQSESANSSNISTPTGRPKSKPKYSWANSYFTEFDKGYTCNLCKTKPKKVFAKYKCKSNGNRIHHLKSKHNLLKNSKEPEILIFSKEEFENALADFIISTNSSFSIVENAKFQKLLHLCNELADLPSRRTLKRILDNKFIVEKEKLINNLKKVPGKMAISVDCWTSRNMYSFQGVLAEFIDANFTRQRFLLDLTLLLSSHTGVFLSEKLIEVLKDFKILDKILCINTDNASNCDTQLEHFSNFMKNDMGMKFDSKENRVRCMAHIMNLSCQKALKFLRPKTNYVEVDPAIHEIFENEENELVENIELNISHLHSDDILARLRHGIIKIRSSPTKIFQLKEICEQENLEKLKLILDVPTRWNSTYHMINRAIYLQKAYDKLVSSNEKLKPFTLFSEDWKKLESMKEFLEPFDELTNMISWESQTMSFVGVSFIHLFGHLDKYILDKSKKLNGVNPKTKELYPIWLRQCAQEAKLKLEEYWVYFDTDINIVGIILDPGLKLNWVKKNISEKVAKLYKNRFESIWNNYKKDQENSYQDRDQPIKKFKNAYFSQITSIEKVSDEFKQYLSQTVTSNELEDGTLNWWKNNQSRYPLLSKMALDYLAPSGSNAPVERIFSFGSDFICPKRSSVNADTINKCLLLKSWKE